MQREKPAVIPTLEYLASIYSGLPEMWLDNCVLWQYQCSILAIQSLQNSALVQRLVDRVFAAECRDIELLGLSIFGEGSTAVLWYRWVLSGDWCELVSQALSSLYFGKDICKSLNIVFHVDTTHRNTLAALWQLCTPDQAHKVYKNLNTWN